MGETRISEQASDEKSSARMNFRTKPHIKRAIQQAAALSGLDDSAFTINAAYRSALETISAHERTTLAQQDLTAFFEALETPAAPSERLRSAFEHQRRDISTK